MWLLRMAWRDSRRNRSRLLLFISSIVLGIAALTAISSFGDNLATDIDSQAKSLLGADLALEDTQPPTDSARAVYATVGEAQAENISFASMAIFPTAEGRTRLVQVQGQRGAYPFYGELSTTPAAAFQDFLAGAGALVDKSLMIEFELSPGDSVQVGQVTFPVVGQINSAPGRAGIASTVAPIVLIPGERLGDTGLLRRGSRVEYKQYFKLRPDQNPDTVATYLSYITGSNTLRTETVADRQEGLQEAFANLGDFLNLVAFIALLLGCLGVASAVNIYVKGKLPTVAILRCLGVSGRRAFLIFLIQIAGMGAVGAALGVALGAALQLFLPVLVADFLPVEDVSKALSWEAALTGFVTGVVVSVLFALPPLLAIRRTSPLRTLRADFSEDKAYGRDWLRLAVYPLIALFVVGFAYRQTGSWVAAIAFSVSIGLALALLAGLAWLVTWLVRRYMPTGGSFALRQGLANLYRPQNQTLTLVTTIGLGTALISTLFFVQSLLLGQVDLTGDGERPNTILFDIQPQQVAGVDSIVRSYGAPILQNIPIVTVDLFSYKGERPNDILQDSTRDVARWAFRREYRVTYRDTLAGNETLLAGAWSPQVNTSRKSDSIYIAISDRLRDAMDAELGDELVFDVQGRRFKTYVGAVREIELSSFEPVFLTIFPTGVLERAPQFNVLTTKVDSTATAVALQRSVVSRYPNVSAVDLSLVLSTFQSILDKVTFVIQFMALLSILTGLLVLLSSVVLTKYQRIRESVLLRTLGGSRRQILAVTLAEYALLGSLAVFTGLLLAVAGSWALAYWVFEVPFEVNWWPILAIFVGITLLAILIGLLNIRGVLQRPPLEVLRGVGA